MATVEYIEQWNAPTPKSHCEHMHIILVGEVSLLVIYMRVIA